MADEIIPLHKVVPDSLYPASKAARVLNKSEGYLANLRASRTGPPFLRIGKTPYYRGCDLVQYLNDLLLVATAPPRARRTRRAQ